MTSETLDTSPRVLPRHLNPVDEGEQMVVRAGKMGGKNEGKATGWAFSGERTHFAVAAGAEVAALRQLGVAGTERGHRFDDS